LKKFLVWEIMPTNSPPNSKFVPPASEKQFFDLNKYPLINIQSCFKNMSADPPAFLNILHTLINQEFPEERLAYIQAHRQSDWEKIERIAHKMKGGAMYTGLVKLQYACQHYEDYHQKKQTNLREDLYQQILQVMEETKQALEQLITTHQ
jgi:two-component system aerobic respiration control sensor histidine kinase ArcB